MIIEFSISVLLKKEDCGFFIGTHHLDQQKDFGAADTFLIKFWCLMFQATIFHEIKK